MSNATAYVRGIRPDAENREKDDFYPTPPEGTHALLSVEQFTGPVREPACGDGAISRVLEQAGYDVESTDLIDRGYGQSRVDYLMDYTPSVDVVTNPPFKLAEEFVRHALNTSTGKVAMLLRLAWLEGQARRQLFQSTPFARVWVFSKRLAMGRGGRPCTARRHDRIRLVRLGARPRRPSDDRFHRTAGESSPRKTGGLEP